MSELAGRAAVAGSRSGPGLPRLMYGTLSLERLSASDGARLVHAALDHGLSALDTAPLYGLGTVEQTIAAAIRDRRGRVQVATKCGIRWDHDHGAALFEANVAGKARTFRVNGLPASVRQEVHASLRRLELDVIDVIQLHQFDERVPLADTLGELRALQREGKIREIGVSNFPLTALERAAELLAGAGSGAGLFSTQDEYSALARGAESGNLGFARRSGLRFLAYAPLAGGALTGRYLAPSTATGHAGAAELPADHRRDAAVFQPQNLAHLSAVLEARVLPLAQGRGKTLGQLGLMWVLSQPGVSAAIIGGSSESQIRENAGALDLFSDASLLAELDSAFEAVAPAEREVSFLGRVKARARRVLARVKR